MIAAKLIRPPAQEAGCEVQAAGKDPFDCNAALNNFFRASWPQGTPSNASRT